MGVVIVVIVIVIVVTGGKQSQLLAISFRLRLEFDKNILQVDV